MSTNSRIGIVREGGTIRSIYCHFDGYPNHHEVILKSYYNTKEDVEELLDLGNLSVLGSSIGVKHSFNDFSKKDCCTAFGRDRGDKDAEALIHGNIDEFLEEGEEYNYLFQDNTWITYKGKSLFVRYYENLT